MVAQNGRRQMEIVMWCSCVWDWENDTTLRDGMREEIHWWQLWVNDSMLITVIRYIVMWIETYNLEWLIPQAFS